MTIPPIPGSIDDIDFATLYRAHAAWAGGRSRTRTDWDERAPTLSRSPFTGSYVEGFMARLDLTGCRTLLDVGCGPGTIGLLAAPTLDHVYGLDYSSAMLEGFAHHARARGVTNATPILRSWEESWDDIPVCDVLVASRSTQVADLKAALRKANAHATRRIYMTQRVDGRSLDRELFDAIGREEEARPDYGYAVNILRQMRIHPRIDYLEMDDRLKYARDFDDCARRVDKAIGELTPQERERLRAYYEARGGRVGEKPMRWALLSWDVPMR